MKIEAVMPIIMKSRLVEPTEKIEPKRICRCCRAEGTQPKFKFSAGCFIFIAIHVAERELSTPHFV